MDEEYVDVDEGQDGGGGWKGKMNDFLESRYFIAAVIILVAVISYSLGRISGIGERKEPVRVTNSTGEVKGASSEIAPLSGASSAASGATLPEPSDKVVASKNGTKYHYPWCAGAKQISEKNKIYFDSIEAARSAGYTPAANCKGLK